MKRKANFAEKSGNFQMDGCRIEKVVELAHEDFCRLKATPLAEQPLIRDNKDCMFSRGGVSHCLLALDQTSSGGVLLTAEQNGCPRLAACVPNMRDIVSAELNRAAEFIIEQCTENANGSSWTVCFNDRPGRAYGCVYFEELEERFGLTVREGNGLDAMLETVLKQSPEAAAVDLRDGCIEMECHPEYCGWLSDSAEDRQPGLRLKDILPLLKDNEPVFLCHEEAEQSVQVENLRLLTGAGQEKHTALLHARVSELCDTSEGTEVVLTGVDPEELVRFSEAEAYDAFMEAEQYLGPTMG